jgi:transcriptional regulator with XRE-family HTH domain
MLLPYPYTSLDKNFGKILCRARRIQRMKQASVADDVGIRRETLSKIEQGRTPRPQILDRLLGVLELDWCDVAVRGKGNKFRLRLDGYRNELLVEIGEEIQEKRKKEGKTLAALSNELELSASTLSRLERAQLSRSRVFRDSAGFEAEEFSDRPATIVHTRLADFLDC